MFSLHAAAKFFDNDPLYDAYSGDYLYKGQFASYDGSQLDGSFIRRRTVSLAPELDLPPRRVVTLYKEQWVLSDPITDGFRGTPIRKTMSARKAHALYDILDVSQALGLSPVVRQAYAFSRWLKATSDAATSDYEPFFEFSFSATEAPMRDMLIRDGVRLWHVRTDSDVAEGFHVAQCDEIVTEDEAATAYVTVEVPGAIDPITLQAAPSVTHPGIVLERYIFFRKLDQAQPNNYAGDKTLLVSEAFGTAGGHLTIDGRKWSVVASQPTPGGKALHIREV